MLVVTEAAIVFLSRMLGQVGVGKGTAIRLAQLADGVSLQSDAERPGDCSYQYGGRAVLVVDTLVAALLSSSILDVDGATFTLQCPGSSPPKHESTSGAG